MGFLSLIAGVVVGGLLSRSSSKTEERSSSSSSYSYLTYNSTPKRESIYDNKVEFFDKYREVDHYFASFVGQKSGGITFLISGLFEYANDYYYREYSYDFKKNARILKEIRSYRNILGHDKSKWQSLPEPDTRYVKYLRDLCIEIQQELSEFTNIIEKGYQYVKNRNNY